MISSNNIIKEIKDNIGNVTYRKYSNGFEEKMEYTNHLIIRYTNSNGIYRELDDYGNEVYYNIPKSM